MIKHAGFSRAIYNYGLSLDNQLDHKEYQGGSSKKIAAIKKVVTNSTKKQWELGWMNELSSRVYQNAFRNLQKAFNRFFKGLGDSPTFKRKKDSNSFTVDNRVIRIEHLNLSGMLANPKLSAAISDLGFYEFRRQWVYKQENYATRVELVERGYPSSQTCSCCQHVQPMPLSERVFKLPSLWG